MNSRIRTILFTTLVTVFSTDAKDSVGDRVVAEPFSLLGYVYDDTVVIQNEQGGKEVSSRQIYLPEGDIARIKSTYQVSCLDSVKAKIIRRQEFRGRHNKTLIGVLFIP